MLVPGDLTDAEHCRSLVARAVEALGRIDVLVNNAAYQMTHAQLEDVTDEEWDHTFDATSTRCSVSAGGAAAHAVRRLDHQHSSINSDQPDPTLLPYATTKGAIANFTAGLRSCSANGASG